jgi:hypothetical protein
MTESENGHADLDADDVQEELSEDGSADPAPDGTVLGDRGGVRIPSKDEVPGRKGMDFGTYVVSMGTSAYVSLGMVVHPGTGRTQVDLDSAQQIIDILILLQRKTEGNLEPEESSLLSRLIYELELAFVERG